ncbi:MAG: TIGR03087 family PEP-CTERM/XrtA system glycosyltransferase [Amphiplicatus sp.]
MSGPEILFLAHRIPYPPDKGDKIRSCRLLDHLARRFRVHLAAFVDDEVDFAHEAFLKGFCESVYLERRDPFCAKILSARGLASGAPLSFAYFESAAMRRHVEALRARVVLEFAFSSSMAPYIEKARGLRFVDLCDADSAKWRDYAAKAGGLTRAIFRREAARVAREEIRILDWADAAFVVSQAEADAFGEAQKKLRMLPNGVDAAYFAPRDYPPPAPAAEVVFVGAMDYAANVDAAVWFATEIWPRIRAATGVRFAIIGPRPVRAVKALSSRDGVAVTGRVDDVRPFLQHAKAVVAPLRVARGVQNKVLEGMAMARAIVATPAANQGVGATPGSEILLAADADAFAEAVIGLLRDGRCRARLGAAARARILKDFQWPAALHPLDIALDEALAPAGLGAALTKG